METCRAEFGHDTHRLDSAGIRNAAHAAETRWAGEPVSAGSELVERRIERWRRSGEGYAEAESAPARSAEGSVTIRLSVTGAVAVVLDAHQAELAEDQAFPISVIETYNSASRRLHRSLGGIDARASM